jgi:hypothetical protein
MGRRQGCHRGVELRAVRTPHIATATAGSTAWLPLVDLSGDSGLLTGLGVAGADNYGAFRVTIDGIVLVDDKALVGSNAGQADANTGHTLMLPFSSSLLVQVRDRPRASSLAKYWASYVTDHSEPIEPPFEFDEPADDGQRIRYRRTVYSRGDDSSYLVTELVGPVRWSYVELDRDTYRGLEEVSGIVSLREEPDGRPIFENFVPLVIRAQGRQTALISTGVSGVDGRVLFDLPVQALPLQLNLEVVATLAGYVNVPGGLIVI